MEIRGPLPFHVSRAYGIAPKPAPAPTADERTAGLDPRLIAAQVTAPTDPDFKGPVLSERGPVLSERSESKGESKGESKDTFQLYTRSADRVDVAVRVALGGSLDARA